MEDPKLIADLLNGDKVLHTIEANTGKKIVFMHTLMNVEQKVYSYFLDQIQLEPVENANINNAVDLKEFNATVKDMLRKDYIEHNETVKEMSSFVLDFVQTQLKNFQANVSTHTMPIKKALYDTAIAFKEFKAVFFYIYGPEEVSLKTLKTEIDKLASMSDDAFLETLFKYSSVSVPKSIFITVKNNIVKAYQHYFKKVEENLNTAQRLLPALMIDDFDAYRTQVAKFMNKDPQRKQARYVLELLRLHALYPHYQSVIAPLISKKCEAKPIDTNNDFFGIGKSEKSFINLDEIQMTLPINLAQIAGELRQEGLQPPYVQSMQVNGQIVTPPTDAQKRSFENTIKIFLGADDILREFEHCFKSRQYQERKYKQIAAKKGENVLRKAKTLADYIAAFQLMAPYINRHKNFKWDSFFGNDITRTWNKIMKQIREPAITVLMNELNDIPDIDEKIIRLKEACEMPIFNQHRNNHWYTGAFGDTHAVSVIKKEIANLEDLKKESRKLNAPSTSSM